MCATSTQTLSLPPGTVEPSDLKVPANERPQQQRPMTTGFTPKEMKQPHHTRNREILKKYPEIKNLFGPDIRLFPSVMGIVLTQLCIAVYATRIESWGYFLLLAYCVGGVLTHWLSLGNHELCHNLCFPGVIGNEILGVVANLAQGVPSFIAFKKYHLDHHYFLNEELGDPDVPSAWEARVFNTPFRRALWMFFNPLFYAIRPLVMHPKPPCVKEILNIVTVVGFDLWFAYMFGIKAVFFNVASTYLGMGIHPIAGHFITEHYDLYGDDRGQETYSYYGPLNYVTFNVGYHNEHHDFPKVAGFRLPQILKIAPEFYENLGPHKSWTKVVWDYIFLPNSGPQARIIRLPKKNQ